MTFEDRTDNVIDTFYAYFTRPDGQLIPFAGRHLNAMEVDFCA